MKTTALGLVALAAIGASTGAQAAGDAAKGKAKSVVCMACHGPDGNSTNPLWPHLAGQHEAYLAKQMRDFKSGVRKDASMAPMMAPLTEEDIVNLAAYYASQKLK